MSFLKTLSGRERTEEGAASVETRNMILGGLQPRPFPDGRNAKHVYAGTVSSGVKAKRRAANRVARASRKANRRG